MDFLNQDNFTATTVSVTIVAIVVLVTGALALLSRYGKRSSAIEGVIAQAAGQETVPVHVRARALPPERAHVTPSRQRLRVSRTAAQRRKLKRERRLRNARRARGQNVRTGARA